MMDYVEYKCVFCGRRLRGRKKRFCNNFCKCKYFYQNHPDKCNTWNKNHPRPRINNNCKTCGKLCGRKKYCSLECKPERIMMNKHQKIMNEERINNKCDICDKTIFVLHVHHINGNHIDNRKENLAVLCPRCHLKVHRVELNPILRTEKQKLLNSKIEEFRSKLN